MSNKSSWTKCGPTHQYLSHSPAKLSAHLCHPLRVILLQSWSLEKPLHASSCQITVLVLGIYPEAFSTERWLQNLCHKDADGSTLLFLESELSQEESCLKNNDFSLCLQP